MATSGTFNGSRGGDGNGPYLKLDWSIIDTDITNNKSKVRLTLKLVSDYYINFSADKPGDVEGSSFTYTSGFTGTGTKTLKTLDKWYTHNSDGTLTTTLSGSFDIKINWSGNYISSLSVSGSATFNTIPRASDFTAFTLSNTVLNKDAATTINYTLGRKTTSFSQYMTLKYGSKVIASWSTSSTGSLTRALSAAEVNAIITAMPNVVSGTLTLTMQTKSGSVNVGSSKSINEGISLNSAIVPTASGLTASIYGTGMDKTLNKYIQNMSKVTASFTSTAGYGATESSNTIIVRRQSDDANSQTIASSNGTTANVLSLSGIYEIIATIKDSRGRTATQTITITVDAYSPPTISVFTPHRGSPSSDVVADITATWSPLGTSNKADITIVAVDNVGTSVTLYTLNDITTGSFDTTQTYTGQSDASSFTYTMTITDSFGAKASSSVVIGTSFMEFCIAKGLGVGIGKVHQQGSLDVAGSIYLEGSVNVTGDIVLTDGSRITMPTNQYATGIKGAGLDMQNSDIVGINSIYMSDPLTNDAEALQFKKSTTPVGSWLAADWDSFRIFDGIGYLNGVPVFSDKTVSTIISTSGSYLSDTQSFPIPGGLSDCPNGLLFKWSYYNGTAAEDVGWCYHFVSKRHNSTGGIWMMCPYGFTTPVIAYKYVYVSETDISGHVRNAGGNEANMVLRAVYRV